MFDEILNRYLSRSEFLESVCRGSAPGLPLCGYCVLEDKKCYMTTVDQYCPSIHLQSLSENESYIYAMVMSIWAGLVASQWKRYSDTQISIVLLRLHF